MSKITILHIDDEASFRELVQTYLEGTIDRADFEVITAESPLEGKEIIENKVIDCIIVDYQMPEMNGINFIANSSSEFPHIPIILMTNKGSAEIADKAIRAGATDYVRKGRGTEQYEVLSNRIINAVQKERGRVAQDRLTQSSSIITDIYERINQSTDISFEEQLRQVLEVGQEKLGYPIGSITEAHENELEVIAVTGEHENIKENAKGPKKHSFCSQTLTEEKAVILKDISEHQKWGDSKAHEISEFEAYTGAPIISNNEIFGTVCFGNYESSDIHEDHHKIVINTIANWLGYEIERKQYEEELKRQIDRLEEFTGVVSHDLRSPLNAAKGRAEIIEMKHDIEDAKSLQSSLERMEEIIEDTLILAKQGKTVDKTEEVSIEELVESVKGSIELGESKITIENNFSFYCDKKRTLHIFENLVRNALEHGSPPVEIRIGEKQDLITSTRSTSKTSSTLYIEDDGDGIEDDMKDEIFEAGMSTNHNGTGFGLSIVNRIAEAHGWETNVTDSFDGGARFEFKNITPAK